MLFFLTLLLSSVGELSGQTALPLRIVTSTTDSIGLTGLLENSLLSPADSMGHDASLSQEVLRLRRMGYLEASADSLHRRDSLWLVDFHLGPRYRWGSFDVSGIDQVFLTGSNPLIERLDNDPVDHAELARIMENILSRAEERGFPFARLYLTEMQARGDTLQAKLILEEGSKLYIDSIEIKGKANINADMLHRYLDVEKGSPFRRSVLLDIPRKINELPYLSMQGNPEIYFAGDDARIVLNLDKRNASRFDFLLGILPQREQGRSAIITGNFLADLFNQFALGERLFVEFERLRPATQSLELRADFPYLPYIPFGLEGSFFLHKQDSAYIDLRWKAGLQYRLSGTSELRAFLQWESMRLIRIQEIQLVQQRRLPSNLDISSRGFGLNYRYQKLDYLFNPRSGFSASVTATANDKRIIRNSEILALQDEFPEYPADSLYNALNLRSEDLGLELTTSWFLPVGGRSTIKLANQSAAILSEERLFNNEVYRIGGVHTIRGFDEESLFADRYTIFTGEYRFLLDQNSFLALFGDLALYRNRTTESDLEGSAYGFGAGISFETKAGIFSLSTAVGSQNQIPIDFRAAKIHFGYINLF